MAAAGQNTNMDVIRAAVLRTLQTTEIGSSRAWAAEHGFDHDAVDPALKSLASLNYVALEASASMSLELTEEGRESLASGSVEARLWRAIGDGELAQSSAEFKVRLMAWLRSCRATR